MKAIAPLPGSVKAEQLDIFGTGNRKQGFSLKSMEHVLDVNPQWLLS